MNDQTIGAVRLTVNQTVGYLSNAYTALIKTNTNLKKFPSVMLWGPPGVGKSQGIRQVAKELQIRTGKHVVVTDVRLLLFNPVDLRGIPTANADKTLAIWLKPQIFQMDGNEQIVNILFLDEISAAPPSVQAAAYQITLDRKIGEHELPENCIVIAAGNRVTDKSVAYNMPRALANRLCHIEIVGNQTSWHTWAVNAGINRKVIDFLDCNPELLLDDGTSSGLAFPSPRSWEMVSDILNNVSDNINDVFPLVIGCVGDGAAHNFRLWYEVYANIPSAESIFDNVTKDVPSRPESLYALTGEIIRYAKENLSEQRMKNALAYVSKMPREFKNRAFADFLSVKHMLRVLQNNAVFDDWFARAGKQWEDYGL